MTMEEAEAAFRQHFGNLESDVVPAAIYMLENNERHVGALREIALKRLNGKEKIRIIVDYDPDFPLIAVDVFELHK